MPLALGAIRMSACHSSFAFFTVDFNFKTLVDLFHTDPSLCGLPIHTALDRPIAIVLLTAPSLRSDSPPTFDNLSKALRWRDPKEAIW
jgi:hypothetical protein